MVDALAYGNNMGAFNERGGLMVRLINKTGAASVKGVIVELSSATDFAIMEATAGGPDPIGVVYEDGIADGDSVWVVYSGPAQVLLKDGTAATREYWGALSDDTAGRADFTTAAPSGGTVNELRTHLEREIGHVMESQSAGTDVLCWCFLHFN